MRLSVTYTSRSGKGLIAAAIGALRRARARPTIESLLSALPSNTDDFEAVRMVVARYVDLDHGSGEVRNPEPKQAQAPRKRDRELTDTDLLF